MLALALSLDVLPAQEEASKQPTPNETGAAIAAKEAESAKARLQKTGENTYELGEIKFNGATREVRIPAMVNMSEGVLEYALVHENGKTHESLLSTKIKPSELNIVLLLCHFEPHIGEAAKFLENPRPQTKALMEKPMEKEGANRMLISVQWKGQDGQEKTVPMAHWILNKITNKPLETNHWTYTGSFISETGFTADYDGSIIATYFDLSSVINCPVKESSSDEYLFVDSANVPPVDTPVTLIFSPFPSSSSK